MTEKMATVAWHGVTLKVPADWSLVGVNGDEKKGYFRVDGPVASALEVRWSSALGKPPEVIVKARELISSMEKSCKKKKIKKFLLHGLILDIRVSNIVKIIWTFCK